MSMLAKNQKQFALLNRWLNFDFPFVFDWSEIPRNTLFAVAFVLAAVDRVGGPFWWPYWVVALLGPIIICLVWAYRNGYKKIPAQLLGPPMKSVVNDETLSRQPGVGTVIMLPDDPVKEAPGPSYVVQFGDFIPLVAASDPRNLHAGMVLRHGAGTENSAGWGCIREWVKSKPDSVVDMVGDFSEFVRPTLDQYLETCNRRDDKLRMEQLKKAGERVAEDLSVGELKDDPHVKDEPYLKDSLKPRDILSTNDEYLVRVAPVVDAAYKRWKEWTNSERDSICYYASGCNPVEMGMKFQEQLMWGHVVIWIDFGACEATLGVEALETEMEIYEQYMNFNREDMCAMREQLKPIKTKTYTRKACRRSAVPNTSGGNTILLLVAYMYYFEKRHKLAPKEVMKLMELGDDGTLVVTAHGWKIMGESLDDMIDYFTNFLGMKPEMEWCYVEDAVCRAEFCSGYFLYVTNDEGAVTLAWTPKVGRVLAKTFRVKSWHRQGRLIIKGMAKQFANPAFCPLLSMFSAALFDRTQTKNNSYIPVPFEEVQAWSHQQVGSWVVMDPKGAVEKRYPGIDYEATLRFLTERARGDSWPIRLPFENPAMQILWDVDVGLEVDVDKINIHLDQQNPNLTAVEFLRRVIIKPEHQGPNAPKSNLTT
jgi:hypothetical protein